MGIHETVKIRELLATWHVGDHLSDEELKKLWEFFEMMHGGLRALGYPSSATYWFTNQMIRIDDICRSRKRSATPADSEESKK